MFLLFEISIDLRYSSFQSRKIDFFGSLFRCPWFDGNRSRDKFFFFFFCSNIFYSFYNIGILKFFNYFLIIIKKYFIDYNIINTYTYSLVNVCIYVKLIIKTFIIACKCIHLLDNAFIHVHNFLISLFTDTFTLLILPLFCGCLCIYLEI